MGRIDLKVWVSKTRVRLKYPMRVAGPPAAQSICFDEKKTANRYLLRFDNLDIETRGSVVISPSGD